MTKRELSYYTARKLIRTGDIGLCRGTKLFSRYGRSEYSHAWMFLWVSGKLLIMEMREWFGGRMIPAARAVDERPSGAVDVYRPKYLSEQHIDYSTRKMLDLVYRPYDYRGLLREAAYRIPFVNRWFTPSLDDDSSRGFAKFCSAAVSKALHFQTYDIVPNLSDDDTEPGDEGRSSNIDYLCTIVRKTKQELAVVG